MASNLFNILDWLSVIAVTAFFAHPNNKIRKLNFDIFRTHLGIPLIVVEWSRCDVFHIEPHECDHLIRVTGGDLVWQKEALLNVGLSKARELGYSKVAVLDSDIVFREQSWSDHVAAALDRYDFIQCFGTVRYLKAIGEGMPSREGLTQCSADYVAKSRTRLIQEGASTLTKDLFLGKDVTDFEGVVANGNPGLAFAVNLSNPDFHFYYSNIVGGGDSVTLASVCGHLEQLWAIRHYSVGHKASARAWARISGAREMRYGFCDLEVCHLWHGEYKTRQYGNRHLILDENQYDPQSDIELTPSGSVRFTESGSRLRAPVASYLKSRSEG